MTALIILTCFLQASPGSLLPAVLFVPTSASQPHRALIGLCHRLSVLPVSSSPLSSSGIDTPERLVAWSVARGVPCMLGAEDAANAGFMSSEPLISSLSAPLKPLDAAERAALNALG